MPKEKTAAKTKPKPEGTLELPDTNEEQPKEQKEQLKKEKKAKQAKPADSDASLVEEGQPVLNIGLVGHVDHGKTTLTERLSGKWTDTHSEELKRGITIRLGYADIIFRKCPNCKGAEAYSTKKNCPKCGAETVPLRKVSFVDAPGHESLMATMLSGATLMDGVLLLVAANEKCPQPQTREHLMALQIMGIKNIIIVQNKIDLVKKEQAVENYNEIKTFLNSCGFDSTPIIPISAKHNVNIDLLIEAIEKYLPTPARDKTREPMMFVARSFDINKPGSDPTKIVGGVLGGALVQGKLKVGDEIEIRPGRAVQKENKLVYVPIHTKVTSLKTGGRDVGEVIPGGSIGVMTMLDPAIVKSDSLTGNVVGYKEMLPSVHDDIILEVTLMKRVVGAQSAIDVEPLKMGEPLMLNVNSAATVGIIYELKKNKCRCRLKIPICAEKGQRITISRRIANRFRLIGYGILA